MHGLHEDKRKPDVGQVFSKRVAGAGIEPASGGYEPPEVPLLYPAIPIQYATSGDLQV